MKGVFTLAAAAAMLATGIGGAWAQPAPPPYTVVPPPRVERVPPPRGGGFVWEPGHWQWNGRHYVWREGRYIPRHAAYREYVPGRWVWAPRLRRWEWVGAHWRR